MNTTTSRMSDYPFDQGDWVIAKFLGNYKEGIVHDYLQKSYRILFTEDNTYHLINGSFIQPWSEDLKVSIYC